jgi:hypothetical protein
VNAEQWMRASRDLHKLLLDAASTQVPAIRRVIELHQPKQQANRGLPVCHGDDKSTSDLPDAEWPCRTVAVLAKDLLDIRNVEDYLAERASEA